MWQVLFRIPIGQDGIPVYGFGMMLFLAFIACTWLASRRAELEGISKDVIQDIAVWLFLGGLLGARITYLLNENPRAPLTDWWWKLFRIWEGGIVLYGAILGGTAAYFVAWALIYRRRGLRTLPFADAVAPSIALGVALGRLGCLLNGCCYGQVACAECPEVLPAHFPLSAPCREVLVESGAQTAAGFTLADGAARVGAVDPGSPAYEAGLRPGAVIVGVNGHEVKSRGDLNHHLGGLGSWPRGQSGLTLEYVPDPGQAKETITIYPRTVGLYPTQLYETVSMVLLLLVLLAYYPFRYAEGQVCAVLMVAYGVHRYLNEILRDDPRPEGFENYGSLFLIVAGAAMWLALWARARSRPAQVTAIAAPAPAGATAITPAPDRGIIPSG
jgi:phosphatidylglycerol---prolipoprotein diacylglyceryl transferase